MYDLSIWKPSQFNILCPLRTQLLPKTQVSLNSSILQTQVDTTLQSKIKNIKSVIKGANLFFPFICLITINVIRLFINNLVAWFSMFYFICRKSLYFINKIITNKSVSNEWNDEEIKCFFCSIEFWCCR